MRIIKDHIIELQNLCESYDVEELYVFGSAITKDFTEDSDIDLLVKFKEIDVMEYLDNYIAFKNALKTLFQREIDLVEQQALKNPILKRSINRNKRKLYGLKDIKITF